MKGVMDECTHMANFSGKFYSADRFMCINSDYFNHIGQRKANIMLLYVVQKYTEIEQII